MKHYFSYQHSYDLTKIIAFEEKWVEINPQKTFIYRIIIRFKQQHTVADLPKSGWQHEWTAEFKHQVSTTLVATPRILFRYLVQHVNASYNTTYPAMCSIAYQLLGLFFRKSLISLGTVSGIMWSARSQDLGLLDFFLWSYLKNRIYRSAPASLDDLKQK